MKSLMIAAIAAAAATSALPLAAQAQNMATFSPVTAYGTIGYAGASDQGVDLGAIQARLGARFGNYIGVEGELAGGVKNDTIDVGGTDYRVKLRNQEAIYGIGFLPLTQKFDLFGRVGYGGADIKTSAAGVSGTGSLTSWNYGGGGQYFFDHANGVRVDYTRQSFTHDNGGADVWSIAYVRKF